MPLPSSMSRPAATLPAAAAPSPRQALERTVGPQPRRRAPVPPAATPGLVLGPYYPVRPPADADHRLWRGARLPDGARALRLGGTVRTLSGAAVAGAWVELWQADPAGRYPHPCAPHAGLVDRGFTGYGRVCTDAHGAFAFDSLVPGPYGQPGNKTRARHLHVQITGRFERLVTQVFFPGDPGRDADRWWRAATRARALCARAVAGSPDDALHLEWDATLRRG